MMIDTVQNIIVTGQYARYDKALGYTMITQRPEAWFLDKQDTLFMHSDTMRATFDSAQKTKEVFAYYHVKFYRDDIQGLADSIVYKTADSTMRMLGMPVLWTDENQLTADFIYITTANKEVRNMFLYNAALSSQKIHWARVITRLKGGI